MGSNTELLNIMVSILTMNLEVNRSVLEMHCYLFADTLNTSYSKTVKHQIMAWLQLMFCHFPRMTMGYFKSHWNSNFFWPIQTRLGKISFILALEAVNLVIRYELGSRSKTPLMPNFDLTCRQYCTEQSNISFRFTFELLLRCAV